jgi:hypothetical protein
VITLATAEGVTRVATVDEAVAELVRLYDAGCDAVQQIEGVEFDVARGIVERATDVILARDAVV